VVFKCPKCGFKGTHKAVQAHYYKRHYKSKKNSGVSKSKSKTVYVFHPLKPKGG